MDNICHIESHTSYVTLVIQNNLQGIKMDYFFHHLS